MPIDPVNSILSDFLGSQIVRILNDNMFALQKSASRLSSGLRIINAGDDPGGVGAVVRTGNQIRRIGAAQTGIANATSYVETQSGFLGDVENALNRMSELATLAQDGTITSGTRSAYQSEFADLQAFVSNVGGKSFNQIALFPGSAMNVVVGEDGSTFSLQPLNYSADGASGGLSDSYSAALNLDSTGNASTAQTAISTAISNLGMMQSKVSSNSQVLGLYDGILTELSDGLTSVKNKVEATDIATESNEFSRLNVLVQGGTSVLAQWNSLRQNLLELFR